MTERKHWGPTTGHRMNGNQIDVALKSGTVTGNPEIDTMTEQGVDRNTIMTAPTANAHPERFIGEPLTATLARLMNERAGVPRK